MLPEIREYAHALVTRSLAAIAHRGGSGAFSVSAAEVIHTLSNLAVPIEATDDDVARTQRAVFAVLEQNHVLQTLRRTLALDDLDISILLALVAPELDVDTERAYSFAMDDFTRKRPDVGFLIRLIGGETAKGQTEVLARLTDRAPLRKYRLIVLSNEGNLMLRSLRVADRIVWLIRGIEQLDESLLGCATLNQGVALATLIRSEATERAVRGVLAKKGRLLLAGRAGSGRATLVETIATELGMRAIRLSVARVLDDAKTASDRLAVACREAALLNAVLIVDGDETTDEAMTPLGPAVAQVATTPVPLVFVFPARPPAVVGNVHDLVELDVAPLSLTERVRLWDASLPKELVADREVVEGTAARYAFSAAAIVQAARRAHGAARIRGASALSIDDLSDACRLMFSHRLGGMAQRIPTGFSWNDLVLPADTAESVREVVRFARRRPFLLEEWGFGKKLPYGRGVSAIMAGPPGTGKTMVAQILAREIGYELYRIDLSQVVNKYIGETEKNLAKIFEEAEHAHAVLFFDEADSLFAKRTEVKSSNDRYANLEVNYLLQRMETYDGVTLLATNIEQGIDEAFKRRVRFLIQFEVPEVGERERLWRSMFPPETPLAPDIDWKRLGQLFVMSGGYIKKAAVRAALVAADAQPPRPLTTEDLVEAGRAEYREMGRITAG